MRDAPFAVALDQQHGESGTHRKESRANFLSKSQNPVTRTALSATTIVRLSPMALVLPLGSLRRNRGSLPTLPK